MSTAGPTPKDEHITLLRTLSGCAPGKGLVIGTPGPAVLHTFRSCEMLGWVESVSFGSTQVWKITSVGRAAFHIALVEQMQPAAVDC